MTNASSSLSRETILTCQTLTQLTQTSKPGRRLKTAEDFYGRDFQLRDEEWIECAACRCAHNGLRTSIYDDGEYRGEADVSAQSVLCADCWKKATANGHCASCWTPLDTQGHCVTANIHMI